MEMSIKYNHVTLKEIAVIYPFIITFFHTCAITK